MSFRNRPVLDRKRRPRWQDELRTQQLVVAGFALAIALALGIYGATLWSGYWEAHLRPVAVVGDRVFTTSDLAARESAIRAEIVSEASELQAQLGGPRDALIEQQLQSINLRLGDTAGEASASLVDGALLATRAGDFGLSVTDTVIDAAVAERTRLPERVALQLIVVHALPEDAESGTEPTDEQRAAARTEAESALERIEEGEAFGSVAMEVSDDFTGQFGGDLGWVTHDDPAYGVHVEAVDGAELGDVVGPVETEDGWALVGLVDRREPTHDEVLDRMLAPAGTGDAAYRSYVRDELLIEAFRDHFADEVIGGPQPQRRVAQILIDPGEMTTAIPEERARHVLIQPDPDAADQTEATEEQWDEALAEAEAVRALLMAPDADWFAIAEEHSADPGSAARGGDLGWYDPTVSPFVPEFADALSELDLLEVSEPVRSDFGYHLIQKTGERTSPQNLSVRLVRELRADPDAFAEVASRLTDDPATARDGGEIGWVARHQLDEELEEAIFALTDADEIGDPVDLGGDGIYILKLLELDESRELDPDHRAEIAATGFERWLAQEVTGPIAVWVDPQYASSVARS